MMVQMRDHAKHLDGAPAERPVTCEEFQAQMPDLIGSDIRDQEHLKSCVRCAALLEELEYIAQIASDLLLPVYEPGESVWKNISASLPKSTDEVIKLNGHLAGSSVKG
jgi:hypothetical protein